MRDVAEHAVRIELAGDSLAPDEVIALVRRDPERAIARAGEGVRLLAPKKLLETVRDAELADLDDDGAVAATTLPVMLGIAVGLAVGGYFGAQHGFEAGKEAGKDAGEGETGALEDGGHTGGDDDSADTGDTGDTGGGVE